MTIMYSLFYVIYIQVNRFLMWCFFFCQAEDGIRDLVRSRGLGDVYKRQVMSLVKLAKIKQAPVLVVIQIGIIYIK